MSQIQSLTERAQAVSRSQDRWNDAYMVFVALTVLLAVAVFITQFVASRKGKLLASVQAELLAEKDSQLTADLKGTDEKISAANERAAKADEGAGIANKAAGDANERAAVLEQKAAALRWQLEQEIQRRAPRILSDEQKVILVSELRGRIPKVTFVVQRDLESEGFALQLEVIFQEAGAQLFVARMPPGEFRFIPTGVLMYKPLRAKMSETSRPC